MMITHNDEGVELTLDEDDLYRLLKPLLQAHGATFDGMSLDLVEVERPVTTMGGFAGAAATTVKKPSMKLTVTGRVEGRRHAVNTA
jgi:hypothetical protein